MRTTVYLLVLAVVLASCKGSQTKQQSANDIHPEVIDQVVRPFNRGVALMDQYRPLEAVKEFEKVLRIAPNWNTGRLNLGIALLNTQKAADYIRAEQVLKAVAERDPGSVRAHYALGMLYKHLDRLKEARGRFEQVLRIDSDDPDAHYQLGSLVESENPEGARKHYEQTLEALPHHESAVYRLQALLNKAGEREQARSLLLRFRALKDAGAGVFSGFKYGEMGRYAEVVRAFEASGSTGSLRPPEYIDAADKAGLVLKGSGTAGWPGGSRPLGPGAFGPGLAAVDLDSGGRLALFAAGIGPHGGTLYIYESGRFRTVPDSGIDASQSVGAYFGDFDKDGDPDLFLTCNGRNRLYRNEGGERFLDVTEASGTGGAQLLSVGAAWADMDHDGDLDLYVANFAPLGSGQQSAGAPNALWRNNGNGTFTDIAPQTGLDGGQSSVGVLVFDFDDDRDLDLYVVNNRSRNRLYLNNRIGQFSDATEWFPDLADDGPGLGAAAGDLNQDGREDLLLLRGSAPPRLFLQLERARYSEDLRFAAAAKKLGGAAGGLIGDLNLDGALDLVLLSSGSSEHTGHKVLMNSGAGRFTAPALLGGQGGAPEARGALVDGRRYSGR